MDDAWLWGGDDDSVMETVRVGINRIHPETRFAQMPAFGGGIFSRDQVRSVAAYVQSLSGGGEFADVSEGENLFSENCTSCHGEDAIGNDELGAPNLTDEHWIYGGDAASLFESIHDGRQGYMPAWEGRMTEVERKIVSLYLLDVLAEEGR